MVLGFLLAGSMAFSAAAGEANSDEASQSEDMSVGEAADNMVEDAERVGDKAQEIGSDIAEDVEDAFESDEKPEQEATE